MDTPTLRKQLAAQFPNAATTGLVIARAPGRVNLIGEHTDYNEGFVCPMAIDRVTAVVAAPRSDGLIRFHSTLSNQTVEFAIDKPVIKEGPVWALYPKGAAEAMRQRTKIARGMDAIAVSDIPPGGGLSSSASFEVATAMALLAINGQTLPLETVALACQWAEHNYPAMPCGIMDQFISTMGQKGHALLLDCRNHSTRQVALDDPGLRIVISNSNVKHELVAGEYTGRRHQCEAAAAYVRRKFPDVKSLRDVTLDMLEDVRMGMDPTAYRRAHHVITENQRTLDFAAALEKRDYKACGELMYASHTSLRDDFAVSCPELDSLVEIARAVTDKGVFGARMTGGGFGGSIVALCKSAAVAPLTAAIEKRYPLAFKNKHATTFATVASAGAGVEVIP